MESTAPEMIRFDHVTKQYPGTLANDDVCLSIRKGEVYALVGENGAGKSTLMNLLFGMQRPTLGTIYFKGDKLPAVYNPETAMRLGISMVHQHFKLVPSFTVAQNVFLGKEPRKGLFYDRQEAVRKTRELSETYGLKVDAEAVTRELSVGLQQRVEILKALRDGAQVLILDEPTAVLTPQETEELFDVIRRIVSTMGMTVILITHKLPEVMRVSDRVGVMRRGKLISELITAQTSEREIASLMVGRDVIFDDLRTQRPIGREVLCVRNLHALSERGLPALNGLNLTVHAGEIVGLCGVEGNGQSELAECISGLRMATAGIIELRRENILGLSPAKIREAGLSYIPEDRMSVGLDTKASVTENLLVGKQRTSRFSIGGIHLRRGAAKEYAEELSERFDIRHAGIDTPVSDLSGGNMQKVVIAREFSFDSPVLLICQPTRGVDIGAIEFIHESIIQKRNEGCGILLISADLDELFRLSDRLVCIFEGRITGEFEAGSVSREDIGYYMTGGIDVDSVLYDQIADDMDAGAEEEAK